MIQNLQYEEKQYVLTDQWITFSLLEENNVKNLQKQEKNDVIFGQNSSLDRKSVEQGKRVKISVDIGGSRMIKK